VAIKPKAMPKEDSRRSPLTLRRWNLKTLSQIKNTYKDKTMFLCEVDFGKLHSKLDGRESQRGAVERFFSTLYKNGHIYDGYAIGESKGRLMAYAELTLPGSYQEKYYSKWALLRLKEVEEVLKSKPAWKILTKSPKKKIIHWKSADSLFLSCLPHSCSEQYSPIYTGDNGQQVPLYLLPMPDRDTSGEDMAWSEYLYQWASSYRAHDSIWIGSGALEMLAYKQLADPESELNTSGRDLCEEIEKYTNIPTYYYLYRYFGRKEREAERLCPICGKPWRVERSDEKRPWWDFAFRCEPCRVVSNDASTDEDERHARIGEFRPVKRMAEETTSRVIEQK
jgi:hypothetical protein